MLRVNLDFVTNKILNFTEMITWGNLRRQCFCLDEEKNRYVARDQLLYAL